VCSFFWLSYVELFGHDDLLNEGTIAAQFWGIFPSLKIVGTVKINYKILK